MMINVNRVNARMIIIKLSNSVISVVSVYAPSVAQMIVLNA